MLRKLKIRHFRCFEEHTAEFAPELTFIAGPNARGKTSLLEAAAILVRLESPRANRLSEVVQHHRRGFVVDGYYGERHIQFYFSPGKKKLALDSVEQKNARELLEIGRLVYFATYDIELARGGAEGRRRFLDFVAGQLFPSYRKNLRDYERALRSRNALLKTAPSAWDQIAAFDAPLVRAGEELMRARAELAEWIRPQAVAAHEAISHTGENLALDYAPHAATDFATLLRAARAEDARLRQTGTGPHRDELDLRIQGHPVRFASEGQQRTLVLALKLGAARLLEERFETPPLLLLDDIFGELDLTRRASLLSALPARAQKIITLTHLDWVPPGVDAQVIRL